VGGEHGRTHTVPPRTVESCIREKTPVDRWTLNASEARVRKASSCEASWSSGVPASSYLLMASGPAEGDFGACSVQLLEQTSDGYRNCVNGRSFGCHYVNSSRALWVLGCARVSRQIPLRAAWSLESIYGEPRGARNAWLDV